MLRMGDDNAGFLIDFPATGSIRVRGWGFWDARVASAFGTSVLDACRSQPQGASLFIDMSELKPMREQGQLSFAHLLRTLPSLGVSSTSVATTNPLTKLQLLRLASESGVKDRIEWIGGVANPGRRV